MHELAIAESIVESVCERVGDVRVLRVVVEVGALTAVLPDALRFSFDVCTRGTPLEGAALEIASIGARGRCRACGAEMDLDGPIGLCTCGSVDVRPFRGEELRVREVEVI